MSGQRITDMAVLGAGTMAAGDVIPVVRGDTNYQYDLSTGIPFTAGSAGAVSRTIGDKLEELFSPEDFGATGDGATNDQPAFQLVMVAANGKLIRCAPGKVYRWDSSLIVDRSFNLDLNGSTILPYDDGAVAAHACITSNTATKTVTAGAVSSGYTVGSRSVVVASATGLVVGQVVRFNTTDATNPDADSYPHSWNEITGISGATVELKHTFKITHLGTVTMDAYAAAAFKDQLRVVNGKLDGSETSYTPTAGQGIRACGFRSVVLDLEFETFITGGLDLRIVLMLDCLDVRMSFESRNYISRGAHVDIQGCSSVQIPRARTEGAGFGINITRCDDVQCGLIMFRATRKAELDLDIDGNSTRGLKLTGAGHFQVTAVMAEGHESAFRATNCFQGTVGSIVARNCGSDTGSLIVNIGNAATDGTNMRGISIGRIVAVNCIGIPFGVAATPAEPLIDVGTLIVYGCDAYAVYAARPVTIGSLHVVQWARVDNVPAVYAPAGGNFGQMFFAHTDAAKFPFEGTLTSGAKFSFGPARFNTTKLFDTSTNFEGSGTGTITAAATSVVITHGMRFPPDASNIVLTRTNIPTSDTGEIAVTAAGATTFTVACRAVPGATGLTFSWHANNPAVVTAA